MAQGKNSAEPDISKGDGAVSAFSGDLARTLFGTPPPLGRAGVEGRAVERFQHWLAAHDSTSDVSLAARLKRVDSQLFPKMSGHSILQIIQAVERRRPRLLPALSLSRAWLLRLEQAKAYSDLLKPATLERLAAALEAERNEDE